MLLRRMVVFSECDREADAEAVDVAQFQIICSLFASIKKIDNIWKKERKTSPFLINLHKEVLNTLIIFYFFLEKHHNS